MSKASEIIDQFPTLYFQPDSIKNDFIKAMRKYGEECLKAAAENMEKKAPKWYSLGETKFYSTAKFTITDDSNLI